MAKGCGTPKFITNSDLECAARIASNFVSWEPSVPRPPYVYHCDCPQVHGKPDHWETKRSGRLRMIETAVDKEGNCQHCGYVAVRARKGSFDEARFSSVRKASKQTGVKRGKYRADNKQLKVPYKAVHVETGEVLYFPSNNAARDAGFTNVVTSIKKGIPHKGYRWERA